jgi:hypothetical protein
VIAVDREQGPVPDLVEDANDRPRAVAPAQHLELALDCGGGRLGGALRPRERPDGAHEPRNVRQAPRLGHEEREPEGFEAREVVRGVAAFPAEQEVRLDREYPLDVETRGVADLRHARGGFGVIAVAHDGGELPARACSEHYFGKMRRKRHNALRFPGDLDHVPAVIGQCCCRKARRGECEEDN